MNKESKKFLNEMFSLMGRMEKHMTLEETEYVEKYNLNESLYEDGINTYDKKRWTIKANVNVFMDPNQKQKKTRVTFFPVKEQDINRVASACPEVLPIKFYRTKSNKTLFKLRGNLNSSSQLPKTALQGDAYNVNNTMDASDNGLWICKQTGNENTDAVWDNLGQVETLTGFYVEFTNSSLYKPKKRVKNVEGGETEGTEGTEDAVSDTGAGDAGGMDVMSLLANAGINIPLEESFERCYKKALNEMAYNDDEDGTITDVTPNASPEKNSKEDEEVKKWFETTYMKIVNVISQNANGYTPVSLQRLADWEFYYQLYLDSDFICANFRENMTGDIITKAVLEALRKGDYSSIMSVIPTLDLQKLLYGKPLTPKNVTMINNQAMANGTNPTIVLGRNRFEQQFNRRVKPNATRYVAIRPNAAFGTLKGHGLAGHAHNLGFQYNRLYHPYVGYDIADTEDIDPNNPFDFEAEPNMINNLTGEMNQRYMNMQDEKMETEISEEEKMILAELETPEGKAKMFNESFVSFIQSEGYVDALGGISLLPVNTVQDYVTNVINFWKAYVGRLPIDKEENKNSIVMVASFGICYYSQCNKEDFTSACAKAGIKGNGGRSTQENDISQVIGVLEECINYIYNYWDNRFGPMRADIGITDDASDDDEIGAQLGNISESRVIRRKKRVNKGNLETLLESFMK